MIVRNFLQKLWSFLNRLLPIQVYKITYAMFHNFYKLRESAIRDTVDKNTSSMLMDLQLQRLKRMGRIISVQ